jgi:hypothetical protein
MDTHWHPSDDLCQYGFSLDLTTEIYYHTYDWGVGFNFRLLGFGFEITKLGRYLLTMGNDYYSNSGDKDWTGTFSSREEARNSFKMITKDAGTFYLNGVEYKKEPKVEYLHIATNKTYDWYNIIDLREWMLNNE